MTISKKIKILLAALMVSLGPVTLLASPPQETRVPITGIYVPKGFDNNDRSEIFLEGYLPNLCYRSASAQVKTDGDIIKVEVTSLFAQDLNTLCLQMIVPFQLTVPVGVMDKGLYQIQVNGVSLGEEKSLLDISPSTSRAIDENVYLAVSEVKSDEIPGKVSLKGFNPSDCYELERVQFISNGINTYSVLPIMKQVKDFCPMKMMPFEVDVEVPRDIQKDKVLLHVRSMNGNAVNAFFKFPDQF